MEIDEMRAKVEMDVRKSVEAELSERYERRLHAELKAMREAYDKSLAKTKEAYEFKLDNMLKLCNGRVAEANRKAENLRYGAMLYKSYLEDYSERYGTDVISVTIRDDGLWFLVERK